MFSKHVTTQESHDRKYNYHSKTIVDSKSWREREGLERKGYWEREKK